MAWAKARQLASNRCPQSEGTQGWEYAAEASTAKETTADEIVSFMADPASQETVCGGVSPLTTAASTPLSAAVGALRRPPARRGWRRAGSRRAPGCAGWRRSADSSSLLRSPSDPFENRCDPLTAADAQGDERRAEAAALELVERGAEEHRAGRAQR